jgi:dTDP-4-dehydrorhamnose 3,5-epimerase
MEFRPTRIPEVVLVVPRLHEDARGFFMETHNARAFAAAGIDASFVQDNHSASVRGTLRGLHYQIAHAQGKLVRVVEGEIFDVAVDLRRSSDRFGQWVGATLSDANRHQMWVPPGFAHGFYVRSERAQVVYKCTDFYYPEHERCLRWDDAQIGIAWPLCEDASLSISARDRSGIELARADLYP